MHCRVDGSGVARSFCELIFGNVLLTSLWRAEWVEFSMHRPLRIVQGGLSLGHKFETEPSKQGWDIWLQFRHFPLKFFCCETLCSMYNSDAKLWLTQGPNGRKRGRADGRNFVLKRPPTICHSLAISQTRGFTHTAMYLDLFCSGIKSRPFCIKEFRKAPLDRWELSFMV